MQENIIQVVLHYYRRRAAATQWPPYTLRYETETAIWTEQRRIDLGIANDCCRR